MTDTPLPSTVVVQAPTAVAAKQQTRADFKHFLVMPTRWIDNDIYGHINNVNYYSFFDTAVNRHLIDNRVLDIHNGSTIGFVVESNCQYFSPMAFPDDIHAGIRVGALGKSSIRYEIGLFRNNENVLSALGHFVHVSVDRASGRSVAIPEATRKLLSQLLVNPT